MRLVANMGESTSRAFPARIRTNSIWKRVARGEKRSWAWLSTKRNGNFDKHHVDGDLMHVL